jgi:hypothetical protein
MSASLRLAERVTEAGTPPRVIERLNLVEVVDTLVDNKSSCSSSCESETDKQSVQSGLGRCRCNLWDLNGGNGSHLGVLRRGEETRKRKMVKHLKWTI